MTDMEKIEDYTLEDTRHKPIPKKRHRAHTTDLEDIIEPKIGIWHWLMSFFKSDKRIGELNGHWAFLFKFILLLALFVLPTVGTWSIWVTSNIFSTKSHIEQTEKYDDRISTLEKCSERNVVASQNVTTQIDKLEQTNKEQNQKIESLEKNNSSEHSQILIMLESMKATLESLKKG